PSSRVGHVDVVDQRGDHWVSGSEPHIGSPRRLQVVAESVLAPSATHGRPAVAVYLDLLPQRSDAAFDRFLSENAYTITAWRHLASRSDDLLEPSDAGPIAAEAAARIRAISNDNSNATVHLFARCPFPITVLVGRLTNTIRTVVYEWDDSTAAGDDDDRPRYLPTLRVRASAAGGVISEVMLAAAEGSLPAQSAGI
ncbi:MAG: SAVED domain-containing protein, partial [Gemmatimonadales bacterium]